MAEDRPPLTIGVPRETAPGERRVALVPAIAAAIMKAGARVLVESGAGTSAGFPDAAYEHRGIEVVAERKDVFARADVILQVRAAGAVSVVRLSSYRVEC